MNAWCRLAVLVVWAWGGFASAAADAPPLGKLPESAAPLHYALQFRIDPAAEGFSATAAIRIALREAGDHVWLHAEAIEVERAEWRDAAGRTHAARFVPVKDRDVARVEFGERGRHFRSAGLLCRGWRRCEQQRQA